MFEDLPKDWQEENLEAAKVVIDILEMTNGSIDFSKGNTRQVLGQIIHSEWLKRNERAIGGELDVPFSALSEEEQQKDIAQIETALKLFIRR